MTGFKEILNKDWKIIKLLFLAALFLIGIGPYLISALYALPAADDFSVAGEISKGHFFVAIKSAINSYMTWQGAYFTNFLSPFVSPFMRYGLWGNRVFLVFCIMFFAVSVYYLYHVFLKQVIKIDNSYLVNLLFILLWISALNAYRPTELFYWFVGASAYLIPLSLAFISIGMLIQYVLTEKRGYYLAAPVTGFLACGGSPQVAGIVCGGFLTVYVICLFYRHLKSRMILWLLIIVLGGALINILAPGNYIRAAMIDYDGNIFTAALTSVKLTLIETYYKFYSAHIVMIFLMVGMVGFYAAKKKSIIIGKFWLWMVPALTLIIAIIAAFPVAYSGSDFASRNVFIINYILIMGLNVFFFILGAVVANMKMVYQRFVITFALLVLVFQLVRIMSYGIVEIPLVQYSRQIYNGELREHSRKQAGYLEYIKESDDMMVEIPRGIVGPRVIIMDIGLTEDKWHWININVAEYYVKEAVWLGE